MKFSPSSAEKKDKNNPRLQMAEKRLKLGFGF
jgi:hypothetical protein